MKKFSRFMICLLGLTFGMSMSQVFVETKLRIVIVATFLITSLVLSFDNSSKTTEGIRHLNICSISALIGFALVAVLKVSTMATDIYTAFVTFITIVVALMLVSKKEKNRH